MGEKLENIFTKNIEIESPKYIWYFVGSLIILLFIFMTKNFADRQKAIIFAKRKIVILRRMLGIDYRTQKFLFEKGILERTSLPFSIKLNFHYLYWIVPILCFVTLCIIGVLSKNSLFYILIFSLFVFVILICLYTYWILDLNENFSLIIFRTVFTPFGIKFVDNFEHILYRAKLSVYESKRQEINLDILNRCLLISKIKDFISTKE